MNYLCHSPKALRGLLAFAILIPSAAFATSLVTHIPVHAMPAQTSGSNTGQATDQNSGQSSTPQGAHPGKPAWEKQAAWMRKLMNDLQLTPAQRQRVRVLITNHRQRIMALRHNTTLSQDEKNKRLKTVRDDARKRFRAILTPEQKDKLKQIVEENKQKQQQAQTQGGDAQSGGDHAVNAANDDDPAMDLVSDEDTSSSKSGTAK